MGCTGRLGDARQATLTFPNALAAHSLPPAACIVHPQHPNCLPLLATCTPGTPAAHRCLHRSFPSAPAAHCCVLHPPPTPPPPTTEGSTNRQHRHCPPLLLASTSRTPYRLPKLVEPTRSTPIATVGVTHPQHPRSHRCLRRPHS